MCLLFNISTFNFLQVVRRTRCFPSIDQSVRLTTDDSMPLRTIIPQFRSLVHYCMLFSTPIWSLNVNVTKNPHSILADLAAMLLSNLTASATPSSILLSLRITVIQDSRLSNNYYPVDSRCGSSPAPVPYPPGECEEIQALPLLIDAFVEGAQLTQDLSKRTRKAELHFLANIFANMTMVRNPMLRLYVPFKDRQSPIGRNYFLSPQPVNIAKPGFLEYPLAKIVVFTEHSNAIRRAGVASTIKYALLFAVQTTSDFYSLEIVHFMFLPIRPF